MRASEIEKSVDDLIRLTKDRMARDIPQAFKAAVALGPPVAPPPVGAIIDLHHLALGLSYDQVRLNALLEVKALFEKKR